MSASGTAAGGELPGRTRPGTGEHLEETLRQVVPGRFDSYEALLHALATSSVHMLLFSGTPGSPEARYGSMEVAGHSYAPCVTSPGELAASGWSRAQVLERGEAVAAALYPSRRGLWINPHAPGGGIGIPWADLRRVALGPATQPAGPLRLAEPTIELPQFYALLAQQAHRTTVVRGLHRAWVQPTAGLPCLAIGLDLYEEGPQSVEAAHTMLRLSSTALPEDLTAMAVSLKDPHDPLAQWLRERTRPFYTREAHAPGQGAGQIPGQLPGQVAAGQGPGQEQGYGYPPPYAGPQG
ncbi:enhanced serine sensitivity protein SseB C-terminal domain-containing protein [Streptomyces sp. NPDC004959]|uniref:enhanced serine sensitivity protein SseB C-terminal domain-containing protein n=1 Tax=Streptomyces sp. NPDC004959 TaxID=3154673 RepID=UPI0033AD23FE